MYSSRTTRQIKQQQRGAAFIVMLVILIMGVAAFLVSSLNSSAIQIKRDQVTSDALAKAKEALIGRAIADTTSPGSLPCPDTHAPGSALEGTADAGTPCTLYIGRLPWKTLGLPDLRDDSSERLWYALSPNFRDNVSVNPINSNSKGTLLVYDNTGVTLLTPSGSEGIAIIFAPGSIVGAQQRDTANQTLAQNYLDVGPNSINNYSAAGPFIAANKTSTFNDRLMIIRASDIMPLIETRVAKELVTSFNNYQIANVHQYLHPANFNSCTTLSCPSDPMVCTGKIPATDSVLAPLLPTWFASNNWFDVIYFSIGTNSLTGGAGTGNAGWTKNGKGYGGLSGTGTVAGTPTVSPGTGCSATTLHVSVTSVPAVFLMPGAPLGGIVRTGLNTANLSKYFEDAENQNFDDLYAIPSTASNDILYTLP